jgi:hypothetical protein
MRLAARNQFALAAIGLLAIAAVLITLACGGDDPPTSTAAGESPGGEVTCSPPEVSEPIPDAKLIFEFNSTDDDTGVHGLFDSSGWSELCVYDPSDKLILAVKPEGQLADLSVGGIFFESREPPASEVSQDDILADFPEGEYRVEATTFDGKQLTGEAELTHDIPAPPVITTPADESVVDPSGLVVSWEPVTQTVAGDPAEISGYEVIVTNEDYEDPLGFSKPILSAHVGPSVTSLTIPAEFLEAGTTYELEVLALEKSGNQTITVQFFETQ